MSEKLRKRASDERAVARALERLRAEEAEAGRKERFEQLTAQLGGDEPSAAYGDLAKSWRVSESAVRVAVHRLRRRLGRLLREETEVKL